MFRLFILLLALAAAPGFADAPKAEDSNTAYDAALAERLGADRYGMRSYVFAVLKTGPAVIEDEERRRELFAGHFANMGRLADEGKLVLAGPFMEGGDKRGLFILNVDSIAEAERLVQSDPAVAAGIFVTEFTRFYGSAALMMMNELHARVQADSIG